MLETSLRIRSQSKTEVLESSGQDAASEENSNQNDIEDNNHDEVAEEKSEIHDDKHAANDNVDPEIDAENGDENGDGEKEEEEEEEEVEVSEIEYKGKQYYVQDSIMYNKKKNGDMGKEVGKIVNDKPKLNKKKKKNTE